MEQATQATVLTQLVRGARTALVIQIVSAGAVYSSQILLARWLGTTAYGLYGYAIALGLFWAFIAGGGMPTAVLRFISAYRAQEDWSHLKGMIRGSWWQTLFMGIVCALGGTAIVLWLNATRDLGAYTIPLIVGIWTIPGVALGRLQKEIIRAFQNIGLSYGPAMIGPPLLLIALAILWQRWWPLTSTVAIFLALCADMLILVGQWFIFQHGLKPAIRHARPAYELTRWWKTALPLMLFGGSFMVLNQTDTLMLGMFLSAKEVGLYGAALKTAAWVLFILGAVNAISAPLIASLYAQNNYQALQRLVATVARWMFLPALAIAVGLIVFAEPVLRLFGPEFVAARGALIILIAGELVNVGVGSVGYLMNMTGHQNQALVVISISALVNVVLNLVGIPLFGIMGAAMATAFSMAMWNIWLYCLVVKHLGLRPSILDALAAQL